MKELDREIEEKLRQLFHLALVFSKPDAKNDYIQPVQQPEIKPVELQPKIERFTALKAKLQAQPNEVTVEQPKG